MQVKLLSNLVEELAGEETGFIAEILFNKKDVNEFLIAKKMELTINQVRNILYKLSNHGLVSFIRKKDTKKGWYIYYWTLNVQKCLEMIEKSLNDKISKFEQGIESRDTERFYICKPCGIEVTEEKALEHGFSCEECADIYELSDNAPHSRDLKSKRTRLQKELQTIQEELSELKAKEAKRKKRAENKILKEVNAKKELIKMAKDAAKKKLALAKDLAKKKIAEEKEKAKADKKTTIKKTVKKITEKIAVKKTSKKAVVKKPAKKKK
ncbi:MAG: transcription factor E [Patescibacteria group bacterium]|jgi:transcription factor E